MKRLLRLGREQPLMLAGGGIVLLVMLAAALADVIAPYDPARIDVHAILLPPSWAHPCGTDT
ncbi:MAG: peptide ABC transporter permease, partial [Mariprofundaceae bacterium]